LPWSAIISPLNIETIQKIQANKLEFGYFESGKGPLVLMLHGFPDTAHTWLGLMPQIADLGFRVVAPFMRGYSPTQAAPDGNYSAQILGQDILELISALGSKTAIVIGHDWGALAAYSAANIDASKISKLVTLSIPHPRALRSDFKTLRKASHFLTFQLRNRSIKLLRKNNHAYVDRIYRRWSPDWDYSAQELSNIKAAFSEPGVIEAALGYYWSYSESRRIPAANRPTRKRTSVATMTLVGENDGALNLEVMPDTYDAFTGDYEYSVVAGTGHFLHREAPDTVFEHIRNFIS
jgi:pimeloyl-ACP methyl ester carboxylesterase